MHKINLNQSEELTFLKSFHQSVNKVLEDKNKLIETLREERGSTG